MSKRAVQPAGPTVVPAGLGLVMGLTENADFYKKIGAQLTSWGWDDFINWWPGWATRTNKGSIKMPSGVTVHHTAGAATATSYLINPTDRPELIVLTNIHIDVLERRIRCICAGGASHGGLTHEPCYDRVVAGTAPLDRGPGSRQGRCDLLDRQTDGGHRGGRGRRPGRVGRVGLPRRGGDLRRMPGGRRLAGR